MPVSAPSYPMAIPGFVYGGLIASVRIVTAPGPLPQPHIEQPGGHGYGTFCDFSPHLCMIIWKPTPCRPIEFRGRVKEIKGHKVIVAVTVSVEGQCCARGEVVAVQVPKHLMPGNRP